MTNGEKLERLMKSSVYFPLEKLKPTDIHKVEVFNALFQAYSECENHCSGNKDWGHLVRVASDHKLCKRYGIRMHSDSYDTYPVFNDLYGDIECFGFANDWDWRTHCDMHYALSNQDGFKESPYYKKPKKPSAEPTNKPPFNLEVVQPTNKPPFNLEVVQPSSDQASSGNMTIPSLTFIILILLLIIFFLMYFRA